MIAIVQQKQKSIKFSKAMTKFRLSLHHSGDGSYLYVNKTDLQTNYNTSWHNFCLESEKKIFLINYKIATSWDIGEILFSPVAANLFASTQCKMFSLSYVEMSGKRQKSKID